MRWQGSLETEIDRSNGQAHGGGRGGEDMEGFEIEDFNDRCNISR